MRDDLIRHDDQTPSTDLAGPSRREVLAMAAAAGIAAGTGATLAPRASRAATPLPPRSKRPNIVVIFTDQERYRDRWPAGVSLPGHDRLAERGVTFRGHYCPATMCTSSRSVLITGQTTPNNKMFENCDVPWIGNMSTKIPTIGHLLRKAGYYTAYKGKWHLSADFDHHQTDKMMTSEMEQYGFADYFGPGDIIGHTLGGYQFDHLIAGSAITWLRRNGRPLADDGKPWCLFVSLVNPHDVMYFDTDLPGQTVQNTGNLMMKAARAPEHPLYRPTWNEPLPATLTEPFDKPGRPKAHGEFDRIWDYVLGNIPPEPARWQRFNDYYVNCTRDVDFQLNRILQELDDLALTDNTVILFTSDHGEQAGAHGLRGKGPFAYQESIHLPFYVVHPDVKGGQSCAALTSHIDIAPTLLSIAGASPDRIAAWAGPNRLPGRDVTRVLGAPGQAGVNDLRQSILFTYSGLASNDAEIYARSAAALAAGKSRVAAVLKERYVPNMEKRGTLRTAFDGRYKFSRYFSPVRHNRPTSLAELLQNNDVELYDLQSDPTEVNNLAYGANADTALMMAMNQKLNTIIADEIGIDDGRELPNILKVKWFLDKVDM